MASAINTTRCGPRSSSRSRRSRFLERYGRCSPLTTRHDLPYHVVGSDLAGVVLRTGPGVQRLEARRRGGRALPGRSSWSPPTGTTTRCSTPSSGSGASRPTSAAWPSIALVKSNQLMPKPAHLTWEEAASPGLVNSTAYRQLVSRNGAGMKQGDDVLIWGASGGLGSYATQFALNGGATPVCVVSSPEKARDLPRDGRRADHRPRRAEGYRFWTRRGARRTRRSGTGSARGSAS